jgi:uncharacterized protein HemX
MKMSLLLRVLALCTALGLGGGFVWWQQQRAAPVVEKPVTQPIENDAKPATPVLLPGSKSITIVQPQQSGVYELGQEKPAEQQRVLLPSSKSGRFVPALKTEP